jgi:hypothetical protein
LETSPIHFRRGAPASESTFPMEVSPMANRARPRIAINDEHGRLVGAADFEVVNPREARASLHVEAGHLPVGARQRLVDALLDAPEISSRTHLQVALPLGQSEILDRIRQRCDVEEVRAAGATCLIEATFRSQTGAPAADPSDGQTSPERHLDVTETDLQRCRPAPTRTPP